MAYMENIPWPTQFLDSWIIIHNMEIGCPCPVQVASIRLCIQLKNKKKLNKIHSYLVEVFIYSIEHVTKIGKKYYIYNNVMGCDQIQITLFVKTHLPLKFYLFSFNLNSDNSLTPLTDTFSFCCFPQRIATNTTNK